MKLYPINHTPYLEPERLHSFHRSSASRQSDFPSCRPCYLDAEPLAAEGRLEEEQENETVSLKDETK